MEIISNLRKERGNSRRSLSKLKLDITKPKEKVVEKIANYISKDLNGFDLEKISPAEYLIFNNFNVLVSKVDTKIADKVRYKYADNQDEVYELIITNSNDKIRVYTIPAVVIPINTKNYMYHIPSNKDKSKIIDIRFIYGVLKLIDMLYDEIRNNKELFFNEGFKNISIFENTYSSEEFSELLKIPFTTNMSLKCLVGMKRLLYTCTMELVIDAILVMQSIDSNIELTNKYNSDVSSECARAFETKKNIPLKVLDAMNSTKFLKDFKYVEIDQDTDLNKFKDIEKEWMKVKEGIDITKYLKNQKPELRFKKLGKHNALGLYYPSIKCICVDTISPSSFIHEIAHFIDYTAGTRQLSLDSSFFEIISEYKKTYNTYICDNKDDDVETVKYLRKKQDYYFTPTEIFARCMEMYLIEKGVKSSFLKCREELVISRGYIKLSENMRNKILGYFDKLFTLNLDIFKVKVAHTKINGTEKFIPTVQISDDGQFQFMF